MAFGCDVELHCRGRESRWTSSTSSASDFWMPGRLRVIDFGDGGRWMALVLLVLGLVGMRHYSKWLLEGRGGLSALLGIDWIGGASRMSAKSMG